MGWLHTITKNFVAGFSLTWAVSIQLLYRWGFLHFRYLKCLVILPTTWRIIPFSKWLVTHVYKPFRPFGRGTTLLRLRGLTIVINHLPTGMILQAPFTFEPENPLIPWNSQELIFGPENVTAGCTSDLRQVCRVAGWRVLGGSFQWM